MQHLWYPAYKFGQSGPNCFLPISTYDHKVNIFLKCSKALLYVQRVMKIYRTGLSPHPHIVLHLCRVSMGILLCTSVFVIWRDFWAQIHCRSMTEWILAMSIQVFSNNSIQLPPKYQKKNKNGLHDYPALKIRRGEDLQNTQCGVMERVMDSDQNPYSAIKTHGGGG